MKLIVTEDQSLSPYSEAYDEMYHCRGGALAKANHIFLAPLLEAEPTSDEPLRILEVGFGAGLNFFVTADTFLQQERALEYTALENNLLPADTFHDLHYEHYLSTPEIIDTFLSARKTWADERNTTELQASFGERIGLRIALGDAREYAFAETEFDWVYLDPFSPRATPELWSEAFLAKVYRSMKAGAGLTTYCVKGDIRRRMSEIGLRVEKRPGIAKKREVLVAWK